MTSKCTKCGEIKLLKFFNLNRRYASGVFCWCKDCVRVYRKDWNGDDSRNSRDTKGFLLEGFSIRKCMTSDCSSQVTYRISGKGGNKKYCKKCALRRKADGMIVWCLNNPYEKRLRNLIAASKEEGYTPPKTTVEQMKSLWDAQCGVCIACFGALEEVGKTFHHNHDTGEPIGWVHRYCNLIEGLSVNLSETNLDNIILWIRRLRGFSLC